MKPTSPSVETHAPPKHAPPRTDLRKSDLLIDPQEGLDEQKAGLRAGRVDTTAPETPRAATVDLLQPNRLTPADHDQVVVEARQFVDPVLLRLDPSLALRAAIDHALHALDKQEEIFSPFEMADPHTYSQMLANVAREYGMDVRVDGIAPADPTPHLTAIDLLDDARQRTAALRADLASRHRHLREQLASFDAYVQRVMDGHPSTIVQQQARDSLQVIDDRMQRELAYLTDYERMVGDALRREIDRVFEQQFGASPLASITFGGATHDGPDQWALDFDVSLEEWFDPALDRRVALDDRGRVVADNLDSLLLEAAQRVQRKLLIVRRCFERFLGARVEITSANTIHGATVNGRYRAFARFGFRVWVPVKDEVGSRLVAAAVADALRDLWDANYGRLAARIRSSPVEWYKEETGGADGIGKDRR